MTARDLIVFCKTKKEADIFASTLEDCINLLFTTQDKPEDILARNMSFELKEKLMALLRVSAVNINNPEAVKEFIKHIKEASDTLPVVTIKVAFEPKEAMVAEISHWFMLNCKKDVLLTFEVDKDLVGGAVIAYKGMYKDYSIKRKLSDYLLENNIANLL